MLSLERFLWFLQESTSNIHCSSASVYFSPKKKDVEIIRYPRPFQITPGTSRPALHFFVLQIEWLFFLKQLLQELEHYARVIHFKPWNSFKLVENICTWLKNVTGEVGRCNGKALTTYRSTITCKIKRTLVNISRQEIQIIWLVSALLKQLFRGEPNKMQRL